jgi:UDP-glucuronate 4-epimerase
VIEAVVRIVKIVPQGPPSREQPPHHVYNVGNSQPVEVIELVDVLENIIGKPARRELLPMRSVDVLETFADSSELQRVAGFAPRTPIEQGLRHFVEWYRKYAERAS